MRILRLDLSTGQGSVDLHPFISIVQGLEIDEFSRGRIDTSTAELVEERDTVAELGLI